MDYKCMTRGGCRLCSWSTRLAAACISNYKSIPVRVTVHLCAMYNQTHVHVVLAINLSHILAIYNNDVI